MAQSPYNSHIVVMIPGSDLSEKIIAIDILKSF